MPITAVVPIDGAVITVATETGFSAPPGLQQVPKSLRPTRAGLNPSSFPSPLALYEATALALGQDWREPLSSASELLLKGLVAGTLDFRWVSLDRIHSPNLKSVLNAYTQHRIGLITRGNQVVGYLTGDMVPTLAGSLVPGALANDGRLQQQLGVGPNFPEGQVAALLDAVKQGVCRAGTWSPSIAWMRLIDRVIEGAVLTPVNLQTDVRSIGPFRPAGSPASDVYLLSYAPGFVNALAALVCGQVQPPPQGATRFSATAGTATATFELHHGNAAAAIDLGEGNASILGAPPASVRIAEIGTSQVMTQLGTHIRDLKARVGTLSDAVVAEPWRLSDIGRLLALFAPDGQSPLKFSPAWTEFVRRQATPMLLTAPAVKSLEQRGLAFILEPTSGSQKPSLAFIETVPRQDGTHALVGDLSSLGLALYAAFSGARLVAGFGFADDEGNPVFDTGHADFPITHPEAITTWWTTGHRVGKCATSPNQAAQQVATLQRFLRSLAPYGQAPSPLDRLSTAAATAFARRILGDAAADSLSAPGAGTLATASPTLVPLEGYGSLQVRRDAFR